MSSAPALGCKNSITDGRDTITARFFYQEFFEYKPTFKLWLAANHAPQLRNDNAIWRRIRRIPFVNSVPMHLQDKSIKARLCNDNEARSAILNWALQGCHKWQLHGLGTANVVEIATQEYRSEQNKLKDFFEDCCVLQPQLWTSTKDLRAAYDKWLQDSDDAALLSESVFFHYLRSANLTPKKFNSQRGWQGIGLLENRSSTKELDMLDTRKHYQMVNWTVQGTT